MTDLYITEENCPYSLETYDSPENTEIPASEIEEHEIKSETSSIIPKNKSSQKFKNISFAGCGFMGVYHIGAACALKQFCAEFIENTDKIYGCSMGSLMGTALLCDLNLGDLTKHVLELAEEARKRPLGPMHPKFDVSKQLKARLNLLLPEDIHVRATGKMHISMTRVSDKKSIIVSEFPTRQSYIAFNSFIKKSMLFQ